MINISVQRIDGQNNATVACLYKKKKMWKLDSLV